MRYSLENPYAYIDANVMGQTVMLEAARRLKHLKSFVYASSSSVYGGNKKQPFSTDDPVDTPVSIYAATKRACELIGHSYSHLYGLPTIGLRFFTVYGPWGRPDMAAYLFTRAIIAGRPIDVFNNGHMKRDFTFIDDIVAGTIAALDRPPAEEPGRARHKVYNLGNNHPEELTISSPRSRRLWDARRSRTCCRCSRATCRRPPRISRHRSASSASSRRRRSASASRVSSSGTSRITA